MISIEECRKIDPRLEALSDEQVTKIRDMLYQLGQLAFDTWIENSGSKLLRGISGLKMDNMQS
jgi:hypothetical protein